ncbi:MAG: hypothetical protein ACPGU7_01105 [Gammaproteobacteria bacterium]
METTFVFVTPRRWLKKLEWIEAKKGEGEWAGVVVWDADDLEQWLEQVPAIALQFSEELGLSGPGVESVGRFFSSWARQSDVVIRGDVLFQGRERDRAGLERVLKEAFSSANPKGQLVIQADSEEEAVACVAAVLTEHPEMESRSVIVTREEGWRFVDANPDVRFALAVEKAIAIRPSSRANLTVVLPQANGQLSHGAGDQVIQRPSIYEFREALAELGVEEADAKRQALSCGRSWSVWRRLHASNPAIRHPRWMDMPEARQLTLVCLLGAWSSRSEADRELVSHVGASDYESIERDLATLLSVDDSPVLRIGHVWKAKAPIELLALFAERIATAELDRFFDLAKTVLMEPDPQLELPADQRWMAQVYGKVRAQSGLILEAIADSLIKLSVRGEDVPALTALCVPDRVDRVIHELLNDADPQRWLSLSDSLPALAEAAPEVFLRVVERSLSQVDPPVARLIRETTGTGLMGSCWHSGLLWALETLAWSPRWLTRVALILAKLTRYKIEGNWGNTPANSLASLVRAWLPMTAADLETRVKVLDVLIEREPDAAFDVLVFLTKSGPHSAGQNARPKWRDDDAGAGRGVTVLERVEMVEAAWKRMFACAEGVPERIERLIENVPLAVSFRVQGVRRLVEPYLQEEARDEDRELIRDRLRRILHWQHNYGGKDNKQIADGLSEFQSLYDDLMPEDLVIRHQWLFRDHWVDLPDAEGARRDAERQEQLQDAREAALREIYDTDGWVSLERLVLCSGSPQVIGSTLVRSGVGRDQWAGWIAELGGDFAVELPFSRMFSGLLAWLEPEEFQREIRTVLELAKTMAWSAERVAGFLLLARSDRALWQELERCEAEVQARYWAEISDGFWHLREIDELEELLRHLLDAGRPFAAFTACQHKIKGIDVCLLLEIAEAMLGSTEEIVQKVDPWRIGEMVRRLEASDQIDRGRLVKLEFALLPILTDDYAREAVSLYDSVLSNPEEFAELVSMLYYAEGEEHDNTENPHEQRMAEHAWEFFDHCARLPGTQNDGSIDGEAFTQFVEGAVSACEEQGRGRSGQITLGKIISKAPADDDGAWPFLPARNVMEADGRDALREGFFSGVLNSRGVTSRSPTAGGDQERELVRRYQGYAERVRVSHPAVASTLDRMARYYEEDARREDVDAEYRRERY